MPDRSESDNKDDVLDLDWSDLDDEGAAPRVVDVDLPAATGRDAKSATHTGAQPALPMVSGGMCPRCGYALRPLEESCPRCKSAPQSEPPEARAIPSHDSIPATDEAYLPRVAGPARGSTGVWVGVMVAALVAIGAGVGVFLWTSPRVQAARAYRDGLQLQLQSRFEEARASYQKALELDPTMGLAAFTLGTTYLRLGDPAAISAVQELLDRAIRGQTSELDEADHWFRHAIALGGQLPPDKRLMDARISTPLRLKAYAHSCLALTAFIRASAALQADALDDGMAWLQVAGQEAQAALLDDPQNTAAETILKRITPSL